MYSFVILFLSLAALISAASDLVFNDTELSYAPIEEICIAYNTSAIFNKTTNEGFIRSNYLISQDEYSYIAARQVKTNYNLIKFLDGLEIPDYNDTSFANYFDLLNQSTINIGLAFSGGGFRALFTGAGELMALDSRSSYNSSLKGLLDSAAYISGYSGGAIMVSTLAFNNWTTVEELLDYNATTIWNTTHSPVDFSLSWFQELYEEVKPKQDAGYEITAVDLFGRILSKYMFEEDDADYGIDLLWSDLRYTEAFSNYDMPFPIIAASGGGDSNASTYSDNLFEVTPYEFGSFSPLVGGFIPIEILGSTLDEGLPVNSSDCTSFFDNVGFLTACSSNILAGVDTIFQGFLSGDEIYINYISEYLGQNITVEFAKTILSIINPNFNHTLYGIVENPFYGTSLASNESDIPDYEILRLVDGGYVEVTPFDPYLAPAREIDVVFAFDNSGDTDDSWPSGASFFETEERWFDAYPEDNFYQLPDSVEEFVELGLNKKPSFFGCDGSYLVTDENNPNATAEYNIMKPLIIYFPNTNISTMSNVTSYQFSYDTRDNLVENGFDIVQNDEDEDFAQCVGCAIIRRSEERANISISPFCQSCFNKYCYTNDEYEADYANATEIVPTTIYSSSALPSKFSSLLKRSTNSVAFPTAFSTSG